MSIDIKFSEVIEEFARRKMRERDERAREEERYIRTQYELMRKMKEAEDRIYRKIAEAEPTKIDAVKPTSIRSIDLD